MTGIRQHKLTPWVSVAILWTAAFVLSCRLLPGAISPNAQNAPSLASAVFGETRHALARQFYALADQQFHRGVPHLQEREFENGFFMRLQLAASPEEHLHLEHDDIKEMMPWLWLSLRMNPQDIESFRVTAYWLATAANRWDEAQNVLVEAQQNNPYQYQVQLDRGRLYLQMNQRKQAAQRFDAALRFLPRTTGVDESLVKLETAEILMYRSLLHEAAGETDRSIALLEVIVRLFPERTSLLQRIEALKNHTAPKRSAQDLLISMLRASSKHECQRTHTEENSDQDCGEHDHTHCSHEEHDA